MTRGNIIILVIILAIFGFSLWVVAPLDSERFGREGLRLGLDLVGGVHLVYQVDVTGNATADSTNIARAVTTIKNRIDKYGVVEPIIQQMGEDRILVQLPGFTNIDAAKSLVEQTGFLEFREVELNASAQPVYLKDYLSQENLGFIDTDENGDRVFVVPPQQAGGDYTTVGFLVRDEQGGLIFTDAAGDPTDNTTLSQYAQTAVSWIPARGSDGTALTGEFLADAQPAQDRSGVIPQYVIKIQWDAPGTKLFDEVAARLFARPKNSVQRSLGIFLDNTLLSAPEILQAQYNGKGQIQGTFTLAEVEELANLLTSGALPLPLKQPPLYEEKVSATLGANFVDLSWKAGVVGILLVMLFMVVYYRMPGFIASLALVFYGAIVLAVFKLWPVTLTLAGFGGFILSIGMAVDANVLIFERMKEELRMGRSLGAAVETGFSRAWSGIRDSNITTIIVCIILIWLASSIVASAPVMGFAWTLLIGVIVSMITAIIVTRTLLRLVIHTSLGKKMSWFRIDRGAK